MQSIKDYGREILVFDIDGVITDPESKEVSYPEILKIIGKRLCNNYVVAFNTGRSVEWLDKKVLGLLQKFVKEERGDYSPLSNLISVCEMGTVIVEYDDGGKLNKKVLNKNVIPDVLGNTIRDLVSKVYSKSMFIDKTKEVILTIEMKDGYSHKEYKKRQVEFKKEINIIMSNYHPQLHVKPSSTTIAIDVKPIESGKDLGAKRIFEWCESNNILPKKHVFICFGDSLSDLDMSDYFYSKKLNTEFVYVGLDDNRVLKKYPIHITKNNFVLGVLKYLRDISTN